MFRQVFIVSSRRTSPRRLWHRQQDAAGDRRLHPAEMTAVKRLGSTPAASAEFRELVVSLSGCGIP